MHDKGVNIYLHCFEYGRKRSQELDKYCKKVYYYKRNLNKKFFFSNKPYIVLSRQSEELIQNLLQDDFPILFEGLHSCYYLADDRIKKRKKLVRMHNIEHKYYENLAKFERHFFKKNYFISEAKKLKKFEFILKYADYILAISINDQIELKSRYKNVVYVGAFHPNESINIKPGKGQFALYHGNLDVSENNESALYLVKKVFNDLSVPLIIAGNHPSKELIKATNQNTFIELKTNLQTDEIYELIKKAQLNIIPSFQTTGTKLKLLASLYNGRHCLVNNVAIANTGLEGLCRIEDSIQGMKNAVKQLYGLEFDKNEILNREIILTHFTNEVNAKKIIELI